MWRRVTLMWRRVPSRWRRVTNIRNLNIVLEMRKALKGFLSSRSRGVCSFASAGKRFLGGRER
jgi:hypothetical protein